MVKYKFYIDFAFVLMHRNGSTSLWLGKHLTIFSSGWFILLCKARVFSNVLCKKWENTHLTNLPSAIYEPDSNSLLHSLWLSWGQAWKCWTEICLVFFYGWALVRWERKPILWHMTRFLYDMANFEAIDSYSN